jgi:hypothetical protein
LRRRAFLLKTPPDDMLYIYIHFPRSYGFLQPYRQISLQITSKTSLYSQTLQRNSMWIAHLLVHRQHSSSLPLSLFCIMHSSCLKLVIILIYIHTHQAITLLIQVGRSFTCPCSPPPPHPDPYFPTSSLPPPDATFNILFISS